MQRTSARKFFFAFLIFFIAFVAFIDFFHTDSILDQQANCPACQFPRSNIALSFILILFLFIFVYLHRLPKAVVKSHSLCLPAHKRSRSPPSLLS
jgi:hypothetical protein